MAYGDNRGVQAINKNRTYSATSTINADDLGYYRNWIETEMDVRFSTAGYEIPITGPKSLGIMSWISNTGVAWNAETAQFQGTVQPGESTHGSVLKRLYDELLNRYAGYMDQKGKWIPPKIKLPDATLNADNQQVLPPESALWSYTKEAFDPDELVIGDPEFKPAIDVEKEW